MTRSAFALQFAPPWRKLSAALLAASMLCALCTSSAGAQQASPTQAGLQSYEVELLIFRNLAGRETAENWAIEATGDTQQLPIPDDEQGAAAEAPAPAAPTVTFPALPASKMKLSAIEETMRRSRAYQPIAHIGWTQPGFARNAAKYISVSSLVPSTSGLQGQIALSRGRYLHLTLDLVHEAAGTDGEAPQRYVLRQTRRMRSTERHYIDSPKIGVIAVITPSSGESAQ